MDIKEQLLVEANYILKFITEIEEFMNVASVYKTLVFNLDRTIKNAYGEAGGFFSREGFEKLKDEEKNTVENIVSELRTLATKIKIRYDTIKKEYGFDDITNEYNALFSTEVIFLKDLDNFLYKINQSYYKLAEEIRKLRKELGG